MFCSIKGMSASIDLESSFTSSRPDSVSMSSKDFVDRCLLERVDLSLQAIIVAARRLTVAHRAVTNKKWIKPI